MDPLYRDTRLLVCVGTGGVGKTTTSAALALRAAVGGKRVLVLTIDPARRLANAMGLNHLGHEPQTVDLSGLDVQRGGELHAMMLDATRSFDELIKREAGRDAASILDNRVYRVMADQFAGVQEYMALERLYDMYEAGWDLIVLDTPPAQNSMDFFTSPRRVAAMFDERVMRWFLPAEANANLFQRVFNPGAIVLKLLSVIGGDSFIGELSEFFEAVRIVRASFHERGERVQQILRERSTRYVVIAAPDPRRVEEALDFHGRLGEMGQRIERFILNRSYHRFLGGDIDTLRTLIADESVEAGGLAERAERITTFYEDLVAISERDRAGIARITARVDTEMVRLVPVFGKDIHTLSELKHLSDFIVTD